VWNVSPADPESGELLVPEKPVQAKWEELKGIVRRGEAMRKYSYGLTNGGSQGIVQTMNDVKQLVWLILREEIERDDNGLAALEEQIEREDMETLNALRFS
jgi:hypothetical protein